MAYQTGTITNSFELVDKVYGFLLGIGWEVHSTLKVNEYGDGYDFVFKSPSKLGTRDVYIRVGAGLSDAPRIATGDIQHPYSDGYTEFVNGLAYQYFPSGGTEDQGVNELGVYGPVLYVFDEPNTYWYEINLRKSSGVNRLRALSDSGTLANLTSGMLGFDGRASLYGSEGGGSGNNERLNLYDNTTTTLNGPTQSVTNMGNYITDANNVGKIYCQADQSTAIYRWRYYDTEANAWNDPSTNPLTEPPWTGDYRTYGGQVTFVRRKRIQSGGQDAYRLIHATKGYGTTQTAVYNIDTDTWTGVLSPGTPVTLGFIGGFTLTSYKPSSIIVTKEMSGYEYDRLYISRGGGHTSSNFMSIALDDEGNYKSGASWVLHANTPEGQFNAQRIWYYDGHVYFNNGSSGTNSENMYRWELPATPEAAGSWETLSDFFTITLGGSDTMLVDVHHHLCNRVHVTEFSTNTYWLFADLDRLVIVVKDAEGKYTYLYTGLYEPYASPVVTNLTTTVAADTVSIDVDNPDIFTVGQKYVIVDNTGSTVTVTSDLGQDLELGPSELFTVLDKNGPTLIVSQLKNPYSAGSVIGEDPLPLMVRVHSIERAQTLNNISLTNDDDFSDPAWQYYTLRPAVSNAFANTTDVEERSLGTFLHGIVLMDEGDSYTGKEVRGQLKGVYACGTGVANEATIAVGSRSYIAFNIDYTSEAQRIVVGPI